MPDEGAQTILAAVPKSAREKGFRPMSVAVYNARGALRALASEDGTSLKRAEIAAGRPTAPRPYFVAAARHVDGGMLVPVPGGVLVKDGQGQVLGAVGVSGDTSDNDEMAAATGIEAAGFVFDAGA